MTISAQECKQLRKKLRKATNELFYTQQEITVDNTKINKHGHACITFEEYNPIKDRDCMVYTTDFVPNHTIYECDSFYCCEKQDCAYFSKYKKYNSLEQEIDSISKKLNTVPFRIKFKSLFVRAK